MSKDSKYISVFIPTYNGEKYIAELIDAVIAQDLPQDYKLEILVTDSGSTDQTVLILKSYGNKILFDQIPNSEFGHGKTRQVAAKKAKGEYILFLSQDATPAHSRWLINMIEPFFLGPRVGCVFGKQRPRPDAAITVKREVATVFGALGSSDTFVINRSYSLADGKQENDINAFFSDVNSAVRRNLLISNIPFRQVDYAEDQALAQDMQEKGYLKAYAPKGEVWHSNEYTPVEYYRRKFDEYIGLQKSTSIKLLPSRRELLLSWVRPTWKDWRFALRDKEYSPAMKLRALALSPAYNFGLQLGKYRAIKYLDNDSVYEKTSLEMRKKP